MLSLSPPPPWEPPLSRENVPFVSNNCLGSSQSSKLVTAPKVFTQREGIDYFATYSPAACLPTLRILLDLGARWDWEIHSLDVSNAFLKGELHERIFLEHPVGFPHPFPPGTVWELKRPVYGLKQAPHKWHAKLASTLHSLGFSTSSSDPSLFICTSFYRLYILAYVDDLVLLAEDSANLATVKKDLGELRHYLGMEIRRNRAACIISLSLNPSTSNPSLSALKCRKPSQFPLLFPLTIRLLPLPAFFAISALPLILHSLLVALLPLFFRVTVLALIAAPDSRPDRRSSQGYGLTLGSGLIRSRSTCSSSVCISTYDAELYAGTLAAQEARWLSFLLAELGHSQPFVMLSCESASMIHLTENPIYHSRNKHIEVRYFFVRDLVYSGFLCLRKVAATANLADIFTKALLRAPHRFYVRALGLTRIATSRGVPVR
ncbi:unnamed protein product [Closterium sp. NIES-54]